MTIVARENIVAFADKHLQPYKIRGDELVAQTCPFCNGGDANDEWTFAINLETSGGNCRRGKCAWKGNFTEVARVFGEQVRAERRYIEAAKVSKKYDVPSEDALKPITPQIISFFQKRCISETTLAAYKIVSDDVGNIVFPFYRDGFLTFVKYRKPVIPSDTKRKEWAMRNTCPILFGMDLCDKKKPLIICEGQLDAMSCYEAGYTNVVSVPSGCDNTEWVESCWDWLEGFNEIILFGDNDEPGKKMVQTLQKRLGEYRCRVVTEYPVNPKTRSECKDANEILIRCGDIVLGDTIESAKTIPIRGLIDLADVQPIDPTTIERIKTNMPKLDESLGGLALGAVTVFTGAPGAGKSTLAGIMLLNAIQQGYNVCAYSGELSKEQFQQWIDAQAAGSPYLTLKYDPVKGKQVPVIPYDVEKAITEWYRGHFFLFDTTEIFESNESEAILSVFQMAARRYNCKMFLIDNIMTAMSDTDEETKAQGKFMNALKRFAIRYECHILVVAHPRKTKQGEPIRQDDISGNSAIVKLAHSAVVVEKPDLRVIKARDAGLCCTIPCCYCPDSRRIYQADKGDLNDFGWSKEKIRPLAVRADSLSEYGVMMSQTSAF